MGVRIDPHRSGEDGAAENGRSGKRELTAPSRSCVGYKPEESAGHAFAVDKQQLVPRRRTASFRSSDMRRQQTSQAHSTIKFGRRGTKISGATEFLATQKGPAEHRRRHPLPTQVPLSTARLPFRRTFGAEPRESLTNFFRSYRVACLIHKKRRLLSAQPPSRQAGPAVHEKKCVPPFP